MPTRGYPRTPTGDPRARAPSRCPLHPAVSVDTSAKSGVVTRLHLTGAARKDHGPPALDRDALTRRERLPWVGRGDGPGTTPPPRVSQRDGRAVGTRCAMPPDHGASGSGDASARSSCHPEDEALPVPWRRKSTAEVATRTELAIVDKAPVRTPPGLPGVAVSVAAPAPDTRELAKRRGFHRRFRGGRQRDGGRAARAGCRSQRGGVRCGDRLTSSPRQRGLQHKTGRGDRWCAASGTVSPRTGVSPWP